KFITIMKNLPVLERLELMQCDELFKHWTLDYSTDEPMFPFTLPHLKHLSLAACDYYNEYHFERFIEAAPALESIDVSNCFINLYLSRRMTMISRVMRLRVLMLNHILEFVRTTCDRLRHLFLAGTPIDNVFLRGLADIRALSLRSLALMVCEKIPTNEPGIIDLLRAQTGLTHLDLSKSLALNDYALIQISRSIPQLETLILNRCWMITDYGITAIKSLVRLRHIDLTNCERITDAGLVGGLFTHNRRNVRKLYLGLLTNMSDAALTKLKEISLARLLQISDHGIERLALGCPSLEVVDFSECRTITDRCIEIITKCEPRLTTLKLQNCTQITDKAIRHIVENCRVLRVLNIRGCINISSYAEKKLSA
ncbi:AGAP011928-PA, partial [Anopheles gambiae str. PEST]